jgi:aryl-alcohol dehydrogenase-like predicted oxidoreductase
MNLPGYEWLKDSLLSDAGKVRLEKVRHLKPIADELGLSLTHLSLAWCLKNPNVSTVILGASRLSQLEDNLKALDATAKLDEAVMERIDAVLDNKPAGLERFGQ